MTIEINNLSRYRIDQIFFKKIIRQVLKHETSRLWRQKKEISIVFLEANQMAELNKKYRGKNKPTDVLSFDYQDSAEIAICPVQVKKNSLKLKALFKTELTKVLIHGILHLAGYDDESGPKKARLMEEKQNYYVKLCQKIRP